MLGVAEQSLDLSLVVQVDVIGVNGQQELQ